jgi:hypothetical protein
VPLAAASDTVPDEGASAGGRGAGIANTEFRLAFEYSADAGVGVPRSPGRKTGAAIGPGVTLGAVASSGAEDSCDAGSGTRVAPTGLRPTSVAPGTAVSAPGTSMLE